VLCQRRRYHNGPRRRKQQNDATKPRGRSVARQRTTFIHDPLIYRTQTVSNEKQRKE
jgi:hypothetical protein